MRKNLSFLALAFIVIVVGRYVIVAQSAITGTWTADTRVEKGDGKHDFDAARSNGQQLQLNFTRVTENGKHQHGSSYNYGDLQGLRAEQATNGAVRFSLVREAGTIECEGTFTNGKGSGTFRFTPNAAFVDGMRARGFDFTKNDSKNGRNSESIDERLFTAATVNVTTALADDLNSANFGKLDIDDLFKAAIFKIDGKFMAEMKATGFPGLDMEGLVKARIFNINADFASEMKATGFPNLGMEELVKARIFNINADFVGKMAAMGVKDRDFEDMVKFSIHKVTPEFMQEMKAAGLDNLDAEELVKARIFNISPDFVRQAKAADPNVSMEELVRMKIGVPKVKIH